MSVLWNICSKAITIWFLAVFPSYKITTMQIIRLTKKLDLTILVLGRPGRRQTIVGRSQTDYRRKILSKQKSYTQRRSPFPRILDPKSYPKKKEKEPYPRNLPTPLSRLLLSSRLSLDVEVSVAITLPVLLSYLCFVFALCFCLCWCVCSKSTSDVLPQKQVEWFNFQFGGKTSCCCSP